MKFKNDVFERSFGADTISARLYNAIIGAVLLWGFAINAIIVSFVPTPAIMSMNPIIFLLLYFALCFGGIHIIHHNDSPIISFFGYNLIVVPFGFVLNLCISQYSSTVVIASICVTGCVTLIMMILSTLFPSVFKKLGAVLFIALLAVIIVEVALLFFGTHPGIIDWIVALIFCGFIGYDWARANEIPKTVDNAIDSASSIYVDIINLFVRILSIIGGRK